MDIYVCDRYLCSTGRFFQGSLKMAKNRKNTTFLKKSIYEWGVHRILRRKSYQIGPKKFFRPIFTDHLFRKKKPLSSKIQYMSGGASDSTSKELSDRTKKFFSTDPLPPLKLPLCAGGAAFSLLDNSGLFFLQRE